MGSVSLMLASASRFSTQAASASLSASSRSPTLSQSDDPQPHEPIRDTNEPANESAVQGIQRVQNNGGSLQLEVDAQQELIQPAPLQVKTREGDLNIKIHIHISDKHLIKALQIFLALTNSSWKHYKQICKILMDTYPDDPFLSFDQIKQHIEWISGVVPLLHDMCINTCHAFTVYWPLC